MFRDMNGAVLATKDRAWAR